MKIRSFLAFDIGDDMRQELASLIALLEPKAKGIKWIKPEHMHCTMKFFGDVEEELLMREISNVIENVLKDQAQFEFTGVGIGVFPNWRYPRVIWAGLTGDVDEAIALHDKFENAFAQFNFKKDERHFRLHLTLGRTKTPLKHCEALITLVEKLIGREFGKIIVNRLTLYKSVLTREGPIYTPLRVFQLNKK